MFDINLQNTNHVSVKYQAGVKGFMGCLWGNGPATVFWLKAKVHLSTHIAIWQKCRLLRQRSHANEETEDLRAGFGGPGCQSGEELRSLKCYMENAGLSNDWGLLFPQTLWGCDWSPWMNRLSKGFGDTLKSHIHFKSKPLSLFPASSALDPLGNSAPAGLNS